MRDEGTDTEHIEITSLKEQNILGEAFDRLALESDEIASTGLITQLGQIPQASYPVVKTHARVQILIERLIRGLNLEQIPIGPSLLP